MHDHAVVDQPDRAVVAAVLPVRLVDDERARASGRAVERAGRVVRPAAERQHGVVVPDRCARELGGDAIERVRRADRQSATTSPGPANARATSRIRSSAPAPRTTFSGSTPAYAAIASWSTGSSRADTSFTVASAAATVAGTRARQRERRHVAVEADELDGVEPRPARELDASSAPTAYGWKLGASALIAHRRGVRGHALDGGERLDRRPHAARDPRPSVAAP